MEIAIEIGKKYFKHVIQNTNYTIRELLNVINLLNSSRTSILNEQKYSKCKLNLMCMSSYVGILLAINRGYNIIVAALFDFTRFELFS